MTKYLLFLVSVLCALNAQSQRKDEVGLNVGYAYYVGEINQTHFKQPKLSGGLHYKANLNKRVALRASILWARIHGSDSSANNLNQINRNLSFKSNIVELGGIVEVNFFNYIPGDFKKYPPYTPYVFFGMTYFHHNPKGAYNDDFIELQPLGTEGQETSYNSDKKYKLNQLSLPFGLGFKASVSKSFTFAIEYGLRKTFTDYLDDVSGNYADPVILANENGQLAAQMGDQSLNQEGFTANNTGVSRGNPYNKDWYAYTGITLSFLINRGPNCPDSFKRKRYD